MVRTACLTSLPDQNASLNTMYGFVRDASAEAVGDPTGRARNQLF